MYNSYQLRTTVRKLYNKKSNDYLYNFFHLK